MQFSSLEFSGLTYRRIDVDRDADLVVANQRDACVATFGDDSRFQGAERYLRWLRAQVQEFPDGCVLAYLDAQFTRCVGHLELQVPYGLSNGYVNLYYVAPEFRGRGIGRKMHAYAERYFGSWEASRIELHVSPGNSRAVGFYRHMGYGFVRREGKTAPLWLMRKDLACPVT